MAAKRIFDILCLCSDQLVIDHRGRKVPPFNPLQVARDRCRWTYNWKFVGADAAIHVHNPHYALELLYDSAVDLSGALEIELTGMAR